MTHAEGWSGKKVSMTDLRPPVVAGMFYPAEAATLQQEIDRFLAAAQVPDLAQVRAVIVPHAGYVYSGPIAAHGYRLLAEQETQPDRILLLGPSHRTWFPGVAIADVDGFQTPLGVHPVDRAYAQALAAEERVFSAITSPHTPEHCLEVQIPFIQTVLADIPVVPMLFGEVDPGEVGRALSGRLAARELIIVSSDLSHYHANKAAHTLDLGFIDAVLSGDLKGVASGEACGQGPILTLMTLAKTFHWQPHLLDYRTSGDVTGDYSQVVGYAAVAYTEYAG
jgi:MEMO1 family protein